MNGGLFLLQDNGQLLEMKEQKYDSEDLLQELIAKYPNLLAGDQIDSDNPRRWLLISREISIPDSELGHGRFSLDHLFLDQDGIPTLVEVKRSSDTRIRREVVGQIVKGTGTLSAVDSYPFMMAPLKKLFLPVGEETSKRYKGRRFRHFSIC